MAAAAVGVKRLWCTTTLVVRIRTKKCRLVFISAPLPAAGAAGAVGRGEGLREAASRGSAAPIQRGVSSFFSNSGNLKKLSQRRLEEEEVAEEVEVGEEQ